MSGDRITADEAHSLVVAALVAHRTRNDNAAAVADALVAAELLGQAGHGLRRVAAYAAQAEIGKVDGFATPTAERVRPGAVHIDAGGGFAYPALALAQSHLREMAPGQGIAIAGIAHSHHAGVAGLAVEALADAGLVALLVANAPAAMAPWGGAKPLFGTNPIAFACPVAEGAPIVVDISLSKVARGKLMAAAQIGDPIPEGWALGPDGQPTTDPKTGMAGTMAPAGDAKGAALALMVELLAAGLTGANYAYEASSLFDDKGDPPGLGHTLIGIDPTVFGGPAALDRFAQMAAAVEAVDGARLPGRRRAELRAERLKSGFVVDADLLDQLRSLAG
ncbi:MAG: Ldh family oxidoreductase [Pseudomonadota bacterium]